MNIIADETGMNVDELHAWAKGKFLTQEITEVFGDKVRLTKSTTELSKSEFSEYIQNIEIETGIPAPDTTPFGLALTHEEYEKHKRN
jgi:hypothetical protein